MKEKLKRFFKEFRHWLTRARFLPRTISFVNSAFLQTLAVIAVGVLAYNVGINQNALNERLTNLTHSPKYNETVKFTTFESDLRIKNTGKVSLHNFHTEFIDIYVNPHTINMGSETTETMIYDLEPGNIKIIPVLPDLKVKGKTILVRVCYSFNENPFDRIDNSLNPIKLKEDPFYESKRRFFACREHKCSSVLIKYNLQNIPEII